MSILVDKNTRVLVQGITGVGGREHTRTMVEYGTQVVAGVSPGKAGADVCGVPVFDTCLDALRGTEVDLAVVFVGGKTAMDAIGEAAAAGIRTVVCMEEFVPVWDASMMVSVMTKAGGTLIGPNCNGLVTPGEAKVGFFPKELGRPGRVGIVSRSGTLSYGAMLAVEQAGEGESTVVGVGGAQVKGLNFETCLELFAMDAQTECVVIVGEIGGMDEERAAAYIGAGYKKPVIALIVGRTAPEGVAMGHAGAIATAAAGGWQSKVAALEDAGVTVVTNLDALSRAVSEKLSGGAR